MKNFLSILIYSVFIAALSIILWETIHVNNKPVLKLETIEGNMEINYNDLSLVRSQYQTRASEIEYFQDHTALSTAAEKIAYTNILNFYNNNTYLVIDQKGEATVYYSESEDQSHPILHYTKGGEVNGETTYYIDRSKY